MLLRAAAIIVVLLLCCAKESSPEMSCFSSNPVAATESCLPLLSELACFCFPQDSIAGAAEVRRIVPMASPWAFAFGFVSLHLFAVSLNDARPYLWFFIATKSFGNLVNSLKKKIDETEKDMKSQAELFVIMLCQK
ncbi:hypothetical protein PIB30_060364 [Stylosanthes scabra]|uniref:Uncharacterized protein n=1 Tax=Stylosanthes scabra TaxID=79078 RepID=A0ABU6SLE8_9FABA|nr:hypothetical protein [Stylosanthes scabra]